MTYQTCSWCHATNPVGGTPAYCRSCGHRADVCRSDCDCPACVTAGRPFDLPDAARGSAMDAARRRLRENDLLP